MQEVSEEEFREYSEYFETLKRRLANDEETNTTVVAAGVLFLVSAVKFCDVNRDEVRKMQLLQISEWMHNFLETVDYDDPKSMALTEAFMMDVKLVCGKPSSNIKVN